MNSEKVLTYSYAEKEMRSFGSTKLAKGERSDCVVRSVSTAFRISYDKAHKYVEEEMGRKRRCGTKDYGIVKAMKKAQEEGVEFEGKKFEVRVMKKKELVNVYKLHGELIEREKTVKSFIKSFPKGTYIVTVSKHAFTIKDGVLIDNVGEEFRPTRKVRKAYAVKDVSVKQLELF